jgi:hypothetical protein
MISAKSGLRNKPTSPSLRYILLVLSVPPSRASTPPNSLPEMDDGRSLVDTVCERCLACQWNTAYTGAGRLITAFTGSGWMMMGKAAN